MNLRRSFAIFLRQVYLFRASSNRWIIILFWTTADLIIWGFLTVYLARIGGATFGFITILIGAVIFEHLMILAQGGVGVSSMEDVWTKNFINLFASPLKIKEYLVGLIMTSIVTTAIAVGFMGILAGIFFHYNLIQFGPAIVWYAAILFVFGVTLGMLALSIIIRFGPSAETYVWIIPTALAPFSGVFYPIDTLPSYLQWFAQILPSSYVFEGMRSVVLTGSLDKPALFMGVVLAVIYFALGYLLLRSQFRQALKKGLFPRFLTDSW